MNYVSVLAYRALSPICIAFSSKVSRLFVSSYPGTSLFVVCLSSNNLTSHRWYICWMEQSSSCDNGSSYLNGILVQLIPWIRGNLRRCINGYVDTNKIRWVFDELTEAIMWVIHSLASSSKIYILPESSSCLVYILVRYITFLSFSCSTINAAYVLFVCRYI